MFGVDQLEHINIKKENDELRDRVDELKKENELLRLAMEELTYASMRGSAQNVDVASKLKDKEAECDRWIASNKKLWDKINVIHWVLDSCNGEDVVVFARQLEAGRE